jgi:hypothetical protein
MRFIRLLFPAALIVALAACGGAATSSAPASAGSNASASSAASSSASASAETSASSSEGGGSASLDELEDQLTPPDSSETSRFDVPGGAAISFQTSASMAELRSFYGDAFDDLGLEVVTSDAGDSGVSWVFSNTSEEFGGSVVIAPSADAITVVLTVAEAS